MILVDEVVTMEHVHPRPGREICDHFDFLVGSHCDEGLAYITIVESGDERSYQLRRSPQSLIKGVQKGEQKGKDTYSIPR